ncbi:chloride channel protein [Synechococcus sp. RSCCF101]|uniref:chloride channel protein n=1 Tax=Synechococcus sp. RSCCF101 TaxID=2511069 RepID=UPI001246DF39|nr:chloride channel protein [Synechococcus sp. RSCCF101]QEY31762.1 chloride channel protein [Synechococcus sp. RSCCF101]
MGSSLPRRLGHLSDGLARILRHTLLLLLLGGLVGLACWPLNVIDRLQDELLGLLPAYSGDTWSSAGVLLALSPLLAMPVLLRLQAGAWRDGAGSGIPQSIRSLSDRQEENADMGAAPTLQRAVLWTVASLALMPLGREGPVVQVGAAVAHGLRHRLGSWLPRLSPSQLLAIGGGAGLAGGFNTPLMGLVFMAEELTSSFSMTLVWPSLLVCGMAALMSDLGGQPMFALGRLNTLSPETEQVLWAVPVGLVVGLVGGAFSWVLLRLTTALRKRVSRRPLRYGLVLGLGLAGLALLSRGVSAGDGERLMSAFLDGDTPFIAGGPDPSSAGLAGVLSTLAVTLCRWIGPLIPLASGVPGGLIDPSLTLGGVLGHGGLAALGGDPHLGLALGMAAGLAGATQLPAMTVIFCMRLAADQQLVPGLVVSAVVAAYTARLLQDEPIYHALAECHGLNPPRRDGTGGGE